MSQLATNTERESAKPGPPSASEGGNAATSVELENSLTEMERRGLFAALSAGTERCLGRKPTVSEFVRLCDAVVMARQLAAVERGLLYAGVEIHWTGNEWSVQEPAREDDSQAAG